MVILFSYNLLHFHLLCYPSGKDPGWWGSRCTERSHQRAGGVSRARQTHRPRAVISLIRRSGEAGSVVPEELGSLRGREAVCKDSTRRYVGSVQTFKGRGGAWEPQTALPQ